MNKTLQEQAQELVDSFKTCVMYLCEWENEFYPAQNNAKKCAHIAIDREIKDFYYCFSLTFEHCVAFRKKLTELQSIKELIDTTV